MSTEEAHASSVDTITAVSDSPLNQDPDSSADQNEKLSGSLEARGDASPMPFEDLQAPAPLDSTPPEPARWLAFAGILLGGLLGGLVGFGIGDLMGRTSTWAAVGLLVGAVGGAIGVGVVATLTLRAMNEWNAVQHPEQK